jgi:hypothetical protein
MQWILAFLAFLIQGDFVLIVLVALVALVVEFAGK